VAAIAVASVLQSEEEQAFLRTVDPATLQSAAHGIPPAPGNRHAMHVECNGLRSRTTEPSPAIVSPLTGIVHSVERLSVGDGSLIEVWLARHNFVAKSIAAHPGRSLGKGVTALRARTGALCEALERYSGIARGDEPVIRSTARALGEAAIHPNACLGFSERQYERRAAWNRLVPRALWIPEPFDEEQPIDWVQARSLTEEGTCRYVAAAYCYYDYPAGGPPFCRADSNGNAAGSSTEDAVLRGLLELVERDAVGIWWYSRARRPGVDVRTADAEALVREYATRGRPLSILDLTTDLGIPVFAAISAGDGSERVLMGFGAHPDPRVAATGAITEVNQALALQICGRGGKTITGELADPSFLQPDRSLEATMIGDHTSGNGEYGLPACLARLREKGLSVLVVDQTRDEIGLPVVKVIVPGLRHFRPRFAPGRLYDVPARLGWVERPLREEKLNPEHLLI
jgi:ribosomal protein S12 methylthiotransferase accessory factor